MSRNLIFVPLLLAMGVVLAADVPEAERLAGVVERQAQDDVPHAKREADAEDPKARGDVPEAGSDAEQADVQDDVPDAENDKGDAEAQAQTKEGPKEISGMSILGNQEAPKSLVIVPWKTSVLGDSLGISTMLDDSKQPVDKEVFMRALTYYEIRSDTRH